MPEIELTRDVIGAADHAGLLWHHCPDSRRCQGRAGFPDLFIAGPGGLVAAELKMPGAGTTASQDLWGWTISVAPPFRYRLWNPRHWEEGIIADELAKLV